MRDILRRAAARAGALATVALAVITIVAAIVDPGALTIAAAVVSVILALTALITAWI